MLYALKDIELYIKGKNVPTAEFKGDLKILSSRSRSVTLLLLGNFIMLGVAQLFLTIAGLLASINLDNNAPPTDDLTIVLLAPPPPPPPSLVNFPRITGDIGITRDILTALDLSLIGVH